MVYRCDSWKCGKFQRQKFGPVYVKKQVMETCNGESMYCIAHLRKYRPSLSEILRGESFSFIIPLNIVCSGLCG